MPLRDVLLALVAVLVLGLAFVAIKVGVAHMPPLLLTGLRFLFAAFPAILFVRPPKAPVHLVFAFGFMLGVVQFGLMISAIKLGMPAGLASLIVQLQAFFTVGLAWLLLGERPTRWQAIGAGLAALGMVLIGLRWVDSAPLLPLVMLLGAALAWAAANLIGKRTGSADRLALVVWGSLAAPLPLFALSWMFEGPDAILAALSPPTWPAVGSIAFMAYPATVMAFSMWNKLLQRHPAAVVAPYALLIPVVGMISASVAFGETLGSQEIVASALILAGLLAGMRGGSIGRASLR
ncbi:MAG: EamA family transporter [Hyphomicrobium sp.]